MNQLARGKMRAFESFRDLLAAQIDAAMPELRADVRRVVEAVGPAADASGGGGGGGGSGGGVDASGPVAADGAVSGSGPGPGAGASAAPGSA